MASSSVLNPAMHHHQQQHPNIVASHNHQAHQAHAATLFPTLALGQSSNSTATANVMAVLANAARSPFKLVSTTQPLGFKTLQFN